MHSAVAIYSEVVAHTITLDIVMLNIGWFYRLLGLSATSVSDWDIRDYLSQLKNQTPWE